MWVQHSWVNLPKLHENNSPNNHMASSTWYNFVVQCFYCIAFIVIATVFSMMYVHICTYICTCNRYVRNHDSSRVLLTTLHNAQEEHFKIIISSKLFCHMKQKLVHVSQPRSEYLHQRTIIPNIKCLTANITLTSINVCFAVSKLNENLAKKSWTYVNISVVYEHSYLCTRFSFM